MGPRLLLPIAFLALLAVALARSQARQEARVIEGAMHHLGDNETPEWSEAPAAPERAPLAFSFRAEAPGGEATLAVKQRHVDDPWHIAINGTRVATLARSEELADHYYVIPPGVLRDGDNSFELSGDKPTDDITFGDVRLFEGTLREFLDLRAVIVRVRDAEGNAPSPARVTVTDGEGELVPLFHGERLHAAVRLGVCYTSDGEARFELPPGRYQVHATRGPEWSLARSALLVQAREQAFELHLRREVDTTGYVAADTHVHTLTFSGHGDSSVEERMVTLAGEGVELAVATDHNHNTDYRPYQERMGLQRWFTPVVGNEVTTPIGHFNAFPLDPGDEVPPYELRDVTQIVDGIRAKGAKVVILNHPRWPEHGTGPFGTAQLDHFTGRSGMAHPYDAMELINSETKEAEPMLLFEDWFALLDRGERVLGVASSDSHTVGGVVGMGRTYVRSSRDDPAALDVDECCASILGGRASVSMGIFVDVQVDGRHGMGDLVPVGEDGRVAISLRVRSAAWIRPELATFFVDGVSKAALPVPAVAGKPTDVALDAVVPVPAHDAWVVCVVTGAGVGGNFWPQLNDYTLAATNPVWLDGDGDGAYASPRETARRLIAAAGTEASSLQGLLAGCDEAVALQALDLVHEDYKREAVERLRGAASELAGRNERVRDFLGTLSGR